MRRASRGKSFPCDPFFSRPLQKPRSVGAIASATCLVLDYQLTPIAFAARCLSPPPIARAILFSRGKHTRVGLTMRRGQIAAYNDSLNIVMTDTERGNASASYLFIHSSSISRDVIVLYRARCCITQFTRIDNSRFRVRIARFASS